MTGEGLRPLQILLRQRQRPHTLARRGEDRVAERRYHRRQRWFAQARDRRVARHERYVDGRRVADAEQRERVEVLLLHLAALDGDFLPERLRDAIEHRT